ncbi:chromosome segregation protein SMC [Lyngbya sp. CCY1209]|uniref:chromosome segregation protein SMC n=1 Tax=Lyngbya sp. CCY1209 TaxID=2886103 RepID=UPI002D1FFBE3|nr:chromosome segregation protein SMC [Lyngbya sp. CCY1209]MEB3882336.1 chromosome segregation protein SMC [Lyngbya sp. CCY1209]
MVHIKRVELTNFKSFGGTTDIPLLPGFTVVSGPNGSGKSNILDALLFALGLSSSKGMRAERLPDLVNNAQSRKSTVETRVTVTFDLSDLVVGEPDYGENGNGGNGNGAIAADTEIDDTENSGDSDSETDSEEEGDRFILPTDEWSVTRKLRVTKQGTYTSTYYMNGEPCTQTELHEQLNNLRIYPEGYNVVLQGDVTGIITMKARERREIIDELAGVAQFDRKIVLAREKLDTVKEREERSRIVEQELIVQRDRLAKDRAKAEKYQQLRAEFQEKSQWEAVLNYQTLQNQVWRLREQIEAGDRSYTDLTEQLQHRQTEITRATTELEALNARVKAMGEEELLNLQSTLATEEAERNQLQQRRRELETAAQQVTGQIRETEAEVRQHRETLANLERQKTEELALQERRRGDRDGALALVNRTREATEQVASQAETWMVQQTELHRKIETLQKSLDPQRTERARLRERSEQLQRQNLEREEALISLRRELTSKQQELKTAIATRDAMATQADALGRTVAAVEDELQLQQETQARLLEEQRERQRKLDRLEAQQQAQQEATGTNATQTIKKASLEGVCGLVCQLGRVEPQYQLALEIAAGGRMGHLVVENDRVAAEAIELLKRQRGGRATFLPLNKIRPGRGGLPNFATMRSLEGMIDLAVNLIECDPRYNDIFAYVFGGTLVFNTLENARRHLGQYRMVTLDGELLEASGAMTGGSASSRSTLHFGTVDDEVSAEARAIAALKERLSEIERILTRCTQAIAEGAQEAKARSLELIDARQNLRDAQQRVSQLEGIIVNLTTQTEQVRSQFEAGSAEFRQAAERLTTLETTIPSQEKELERDRDTLAQLEAAHSHSEWQQMQATLRGQEADLQAKETALAAVDRHLIELDTQQQRLQEKLQGDDRRLAEYRRQQDTLTHQLADIRTRLAAVAEQIAKTRASMAEVEERLGEEKIQRDRAEADLREMHLAKQQLEWQIQKLQETQQGRREQLAIKQEQLETQKAELPDPLPSVPKNTDLAAVQRDIKSLQKRMEALEPVNMLALEEYERTQARLDELSQKLATLEGERTELLLRIENFTTLRRRAFQEAFDAVNENFQTIFATLSEGDGYLEIDDPEEPFSSGLNLIAHPKGKPVQRLASMSGGEKSLTALSFIFALQRYRPSPFYAFDEVDMFLDGANVERLAKMIKQQAEQAQFIVVSLRRPMMEASERTIGVTQARGAYTQVLGLKL